MGDKHLAAGDSGIAGFEVIDRVSLLRPDDGKRDPFQQGISVAVRVAGDLPPPAFRGEFGQNLPGGLHRRDAVTFYFQPLGDFFKEFDLLGQGGTHLRKPFPLGVTIVAGRSLCL